MKMAYLLVASNSSDLLVISLLYNNRHVLDTQGDININDSRFCVVKIMKIESHNFLAYLKAHQYTKKSGTRRTFGNRISVVVPLSNTNKRIHTHFLFTPRSLLLPASFLHVKNGWERNTHTHTHTHTYTHGTAAHAHVHVIMMESS